MAAPDREWIRPVVDLLTFGGKKIETKLSNLHHGRDTKRVRYEWAGPISKD